MVICFKIALFDRLARACTARNQFSLRYPVVRNVIGFLCFLLMGQAYGSIPTIYSVTPASGPVGTTVVIQGATFAGDASGMEVRFGTIRADILSVIGNTIEAVVPAGAVYDYVTVRNFNDSRIGYSPRPFIVTFDGNGAIASDSFLPQINLAVGEGSGPTNVAAGDVDGDGRIDLVTANTTAGTLSIFRNLSTGSGPLTAASFASPFNITTGAVWAIEVADLDADGKPEIVATIPTQAKVIVLRNTATPGVIDAASFSPKVEYPTPSDGYGLAVGDVNGDAKPELVVTNSYSGSVSVLQNATWGGAFNVNTFAPRTDFTTGSQPRDVALGDLDEDGFVDLIVTNKTDHTFSVLRGLNNSGTTTASSFAARQDYYAGTGPTSIVLADIDRDNKLDVVTSNTFSYTTCINLNLTQPGQLNASSFGPRNEFATGFEPMKLAVADLDGDGYPDAVTSNDNVTKSVALFENSNVEGAALTNSYLPRIDISAGSKVSGLVVGDFNHDGKPDIAVTSSSTGTVSLFINNNMPESTSPVLTSFSPLNGNFLDHIVIEGSRFSANPTSNVVRVNGLQARVITASATSLTVEVPFGGTTGKISVEVNGIETVTSTSDFTVFQIPAINSFAPLSGAVGTTVTINGTNFSTTKADNIVYFGGTRATVVTASPTQLNVQVPVGATFKPISVAVHGMIAYSTLPFTVKFNSPPLTTASFAHRTDVPTSLSFYRKQGELGDIDGDGKLDIVVCAYDKISVFRNISTPGALSAGSFGPEVAIPAGRANPDLAVLQLADLDADGKLDILISDYGHGTVSYFRNVSSPGNISSTSFAAPVQIPIDNGTYAFDVSDLDADGKLDIVASTLFSGWTISIVKNKSITGALSFAPSVLLNAGANAFDLVLGDFDGDHKVDLAYPNLNETKNLAMFRNTTTQGVVDANAFAAPVLFPTFQFTESMAAGDIDGDGKLDIAAGTYSAAGAKGVSVLRNTSNVGTITSGSMAPKVDVAIGHEPDVALGDVDGDGKPDLITHDCGASSCPILISRNVSTAGSITTSSFETIQIAGSEGSNFFLVGDVDGDGKPEIISNDDNAITILQDIPTTLTITGFTPQAGPVGTTVVITGANFSTVPAENIVKFNGTNGVVLSSTATSIAAVVPADATIGPISVTYLGRTANSASVFTVVKQSQVISFEPLPATTYGSGTFALAATSSSGLPVRFRSSNAAVATVSDNVVTITGAGNTSITASQAGNGAYAPAVDVVRMLVVNKATQSITLDSLSAKQTSDAPFELQGTTSSGLIVNYQSSNTAVATVALNVVRVVGAGTTSITASQPGNSNYEAATSVVRTLVIKTAPAGQKMWQDITFDPLPEKVFGNSSFILSGKSSAGLLLTYTSDNTSVASVSGNVVTIHGAGTTTITAHQGGDAQYNAAADVERILLVKKAEQTISFAELAARQVDDDPFNPGATASSGLPVTYTSSSTSIATVVGTLVTIHGDGTVTITAHQSGNANYHEAPSVARTLEVTMVTAIEQGFNGELELFPNPTSSDITLACAECNSRVMSVFVYDSHGREVMHEEVSSAGTLKIDMARLPNGVYNVHVVQGNKTIYKKVLKQQ